MGRISLLDGATGTRLWQLAEENGWKKDPVWKFNIDHPDIVLKAAREYVSAGSGIITTNTFSANELSVKRSSDLSVREIVKAAVRLAKAAADGTCTKTALDIGPLPVLMEPYGDLEEEEAADLFSEIIDAAAEEKPDYILFETFIDLNMLRIAAEAASSYDVPILCSMSFEKAGRTIMGNSVDDMIKTLEPLHVAAVGANCSLGPALLYPVIKEFSEKTSLPVLFKPNAGLPVTGSDGRETTAIGPAEFVNEILPALPMVKYVGACCGSDSTYISALREAIEKFD